MSIEHKVSETQTPQRVITGRIELFHSCGAVSIFERNSDGSVYCAVLTAEEMRFHITPTFSPIPEESLSTYGFDWEKGTNQLPVNSKTSTANSVFFHRQP